MDSLRSKENLNQFEHIFGKTNSKPRMFVAPARINIIGEHVDYLGGIVLPAAIDFSVQLFLRPNQSPFYQFHSITYHETIKVEKPFRPNPTSPWTDYITGVIVEIEALGYQVPGFDVLVDGNIPQGSGLSSSAALEVVTGFAISETFRLGIPKEQIAVIGQKAENNFVGTKCGIMDQFIIAVGKENDCISLNTESLKYSYHHFELGDHEFYLVNSNVKHNLKDSAYNKRRQECESALAKIQIKHPNIKQLYDVALSEEEIRDCGLNSEELKRTLHVVTERERTKLVIQGLETNQFAQVGEALYGAHESLSKNFEVSCEETDFIVSTLKGLGVMGARMIGGGFGGCVLVLDKKEHFVKINPEMKKSYQQKFNLALDFYKFQISDGVREISI
ncbi:Galactokinase [Leptospira biflexa serovar Patoc strain 'Patoc 1 (Ames)']|uniref:Galactokinase n=1 Tax=Leptospira biflexa serovar Patoc (strain Patoc 1 / ATCC 23582 / Paris) TaxID=456481 RepID=B0SJQ7_LEPBP|nr:Galactokinase [Leptospira biflexa serovar Patoc strain 'Patoc 1 (Ames)']ABZ96220.1 Galactokinase (Galactose kinase) [Leptospira biflexa serovar Patoc strain 'Patoc 1 (Paris)']